MLAQILIWLNENSSAITAVSIFGAGLVWVLKMPFDKYSNETLSIAKWEKLIALNEVAIRDNIGFMDDWQNAISASRPYNCHFETLLAGDVQAITISDLRLTNKLLQINYMMKRSSDDLSNLYRGYWDILPKIAAIPDPHAREADLTRYHQTISSAIRDIRKSHQVTHSELIPILAYLQVAGRVRAHSLFGYAKVSLLLDVWPRATKKRIDSKIIKLQKEMVSKGFIVEDTK